MTHKDNWELELNQLTSKSWKEGLWHSESKFNESIKSFIHSLLSSHTQQILEEFPKRREMPDYFKARRKFDCNAGFNTCLEQCRKIIEKL